MDPLVGFHFSVVFELVPILPIDTKFQNISGLKSSIETESLAEGGQNRFKHNLPSNSKYEDLVLKRGLTNDLSSLNIWCTNAIENFTFVPTNAIISLLNEESTPLKSWYISHCIPVKLEISDFNAEESQIVIQTLTLKYNYFKEIPLVGLITSL